MEFRLEIVTNIDEVKEIKMIRKNVNGVAKETSRGVIGGNLGLEKCKMLPELVMSDIAVIGNAQDREHTRKQVGEKLEKRWSRVCREVRNHP